jgi:UDP-N-acetylmuramate--alanine ligase
MQLFDFAREGDPVVLVELLPADPLAEDRFHYAGIGGSGMSAIAQFQVMRGGRASGSDRGFDRGANPAERARLEDLGIEVFPQDGSGARGDCAALVVSTAVEKDVPDVVAARAEGIPVVHRSDVLAHFVRDHRTIAVTGTSGKSTTAGMIFEILRVAGRDPSIITGGDLGSLRERGFWGNAYAGKRGAGTGAPTGKDLLVIEADESDGTLVHYEPAIGVVLNLQRDHREMDDVLRMFRAFAGQTREALVAGEDERLSGLLRDTTVFGFTERARIRGRNVETDGGGVRFEVDGDMFRLPVPGRHNVENALAAIAACRLLEVTPDDIARGLASFSGISRRFETVGIARGVEVVDDFAHNPAKIAAAIATAQSRVRGRVLAVYQPHGFGPTRFLRPDLVAAFSRALRMTGRSIDRDRLWLLDIFYAGGTAVRDISSLDLVRDIAGHGVACELASSRPELIARLAAEARPDDIILVMGARDPSLSDLARNILSELAATG